MKNNNKMYLEDLKTVYEIIDKLEITIFKKHLGNIDNHDGSGNSNLYGIKLKENDKFFCYLKETDFWSSDDVLTTKIIEMDLKDLKKIKTSKKFKNEVLQIFKDKDKEIKSGKLSIDDFHNWYTKCDNFINYLDTLIERVSNKKLHLTPKFDNKKDFSDIEFILSCDSKKNGIMNDILKKTFEKNDIKNDLNK